MPARRPHHVRSDAGSPSEAQRCDWYAVTEDGACAVRLTGNLTVGERGDDELALNPGAAEFRWVRFELVAEAAAVVACPHGRLLDQAWRPLARQTLEPGLCLELPNNRVRISRSIQNPAADGPVVLVRSAKADAADTPPTRVAAVVPEKAAAGSAPEPGHAVAPDQSAEPVVPASGTPASGTPAWTLEPRASGMSPWRSALVAAAVLGILVIVALVAGRPVFVTAPPTGRTDMASSAPQETSADSRDPVVPVRLPSVAKRLLALPAPETPPVPAASAGAGGPSVASERPPIDTETSAPWPSDPRLTRTEALIEAERITYPPGDNAVELLTGVLADHPGHPEAMNLLGRCTTRLLDAARQARAAGREFEARNLLEELLGFNPNHPEARALWAEWVDTQWPGA